MSRLGSLFFGASLERTFAAMQLPPLFTSNMVLQQSATEPAVLQGFADPGETVTLEDTSTFHPQSVYTTTADQDGKWLIQLAPYAIAADDPNVFQLALSSSSVADSIVADNVAYGDVILCSGQSNMGLTLNGGIYNTTAIVADAERPEIRLFSVPQSFSETPSTALQGSNTWMPAQANSTHLRMFSAICYLTALELQRQRTPLPDVGRRFAYGLIASAIGSTDVQSWMSAEARDGALKTCWGDEAEELPPSHSMSPKNGTKATWLWNAMIAPLAPYSLRAVLWDQGENNANYCTRAQYNCLFSSMIEDWRRVWNQPNLPVTFAQIGGFPLRNANDNIIDIRFGQSDVVPEDGSNGVAFSNLTGVVHLPYTAMAPTYDLGSAQEGDDRWSIHCKNKTEVGRRMSLQLLQLLEPGLQAEWSGPVVASVERFLDAQQRPFVEITMQHADGLALLPAEGCVDCCDQTKRRTSTTPFLFEVANQKGKWLRASGAVQDGKVVVTPHSDVAGEWLSAVRFGHLDVPQCSLYNSVALPAVAFEFPAIWPAERSAVAKQEVLV